MFRGERGGPQQEIQSWEGVVWGSEVAQSNRVTEKKKQNWKGQAPGGSLPTRKAFWRWHLPEMNNEETAVQIPCAWVLGTYSYGALFYPKATRTVSIQPNGLWICEAHRPPRLPNPGCTSERCWNFIDMWIWSNFITQIYIFWKFQITVAIKT